MGDETIVRLTVRSPRFGLIDRALPIVDADGVLGEVDQIERAIGKLMFYVNEEIAKSMPRECPLEDCISQIIGEMMKGREVAKSMRRQKK